MYALQNCVEISNCWSHMAAMKGSHIM